MEEQHRLSPTAQTQPNEVPAQLWVGNDEQLDEKVREYLRSQLCPNKGCGSCACCRQIVDDRHHAVRWFCPEKYYTNDTIADLFETIAFTLEPSEQFFFILKRADFLTASCANMLLKPIEEPPPGYRFILLAQRLEPVLPTIRSRCSITIHTHTAQAASSHPLFEACATTRPADPSAFLKTLDSSKINERETIELLDALLRHWNNHYHTACASNKQTHLRILTRVITIIEEAIAQPPMPGSCKIFWKNLFLQIKACHPATETAHHKR